MSGQPPPDRRPTPPPQRPAQPFKPAAPTASPPPPPEPPTVMDEADMQTCEQLQTAFMNAQARLGRTERAWNLAAVEFYRLEAEMSRLETDIRERYGLGPEDAFHPGTGKILRRTAH